mmetsp:Transcript_11694/g.24444  ORF Transcript_11694/g.24444 Transcript_11694/m.24444 type:complete len:239 (-) Transcript_11694:556-1272(-)|eukprot:CAMPEP_0183319222 /NCGR_PEP_ID=MMETSP0160_2-20130417/62929_1 /TAXON_ID=2839 ORGANISM="Odontella Sinensis, Strain Grunow 1884" /NCGR_SAMPLE_ID=MMETSP0160_2 /ASSEMBLY_ACC=CAM_ASM_000250 /LENGTH=238 /DNA_ID=CAMNT_0025485663 /DNA_START=22 /DNA_END=738 /DNA_ORIENTATION=-
MNKRPPAPSSGPTSTARVDGGVPLLTAGAIRESILARRESETSLRGSGVVLAVFGSVDLHDVRESEALCRAVGYALGQRLPGLTVVTGANAAVHDIVARSFRRAVESTTGTKARLYHLAPVGFRCGFDHGEVLVAGTDMAERRSLLARCADVAVSVEGGPGTADEMSNAWLWGTKLIPLGRSGGASAGMFDAPSDKSMRPDYIDEDCWEALWDKSVDVGDSASAVADLVESLEPKESS